MTKDVDWVVVDVRFLLLFAQLAYSFRMATLFIVEQTLIIKTDFYLYFPNTDKPEAAKWQSKRHSYLHLCRPATVQPKCLFSGSY